MADSTLDMKGLKEVDFALQLKIEKGRFEVYWLGGDFGSEVKFIFLGPIFVGRVRVAVIPFLFSIERRDASWRTNKLAAKDLVRLVCRELLGLDFPPFLLFLF
jgi:hypothetical protein